MPFAAKVTRNLWLNYKRRLFHCIADFPPQMLWGVLVLSYNTRMFATGLPFFSCSITDQSQLQLACGALWGVTRFVADLFSCIHLWHFSPLPALRDAGSVHHFDPDCTNFVLAFMIPWGWILLTFELLRCFHSCGMDCQIWYNQSCSPISGGKKSICRVENRLHRPPVPSSTYTLSPRPNLHRAETVWQQESESKWFE